MDGWDGIPFHGSTAAKVGFEFESRLCEVGGEGRGGGADEGV